MGTFRSTAKNMMFAVVASVLFSIFCSAHADMPPPTFTNEKAPEKYTAELETTKGPIRIDVNREWAPNGADRFYNLIKGGYYDNTRFFRYVDGFMVQFGINGDPETQKLWGSAAANIKDDKVLKGNS